VTVEQVQDVVEQVLMAGGYYKEAKAYIIYREKHKDINKFNVLDKGGGYAIQFLLSGYGGLVDSFKGGITTIIGLPLEYLENLLSEFGVKSKKNWRKQCKIKTGYEY